MSKPLAFIGHWSGVKVTVSAAAPELGLATIDVSHDDIAFGLSLNLNESELRTLRDGIDKALAFISHNVKKG